MTMQQYLDDIEDAATRLIDAIYEEKKAIDVLQEQVVRRTREVQDAADKAGFLALNPELDDEGLGTLNYWEAHFGTAEIRKMQEEIDVLEQHLANRRVSIDALATGLLQIAKVAVSMPGGGRNSSPFGRNVGSQPLRTVIWEARNRAMHFDDQRGPHEPVRQCFAALEAEIDSRFSLSANPTASFAFDVVDLLGWSSFQSFADDLRSLEPTSTPAATP